MMSKQFKLVSAALGASAVVAMGALGVAVSEAPTGTATFSEGPDATLGETVDESTPATAPETTMAEPPVTATPPDGYEMP